ncbi:MAG: hypothetical protein OXI02_03825 [Candidatus Dadabacteria bacterium]|nr:hypothetical protein [Candidatus Dadabacteria bacterium]MDE0477173.1 hypothetical protein [Candidatus Dadabacteria bacterium]
MHKILILSLLFVLLAVPARAKEENSLLQRHPSFLKGELTCSDKSKNTKTTCWIIEGDEMSELGKNAMEAHKLSLGLKTYRPWGMFCDNGIVYTATNSISKERIKEGRDLLMRAPISKNKDFDIDIATRNSTFSQARFMIYMNAWDINEEIHHRLTGVDNYDPKAHEKRREELKKKSGEKNN